MNFELPTKAISDSILLSIQEGVTIYDQGFRLAAWNDKYAGMGITPREHVQLGLHIEDTYKYAAELGVFGPGDPQEIANRRISQVYAGDSPAVEDLRSSDGRAIEIRRYFLPGIGVAAVFSDVTETRRLTANAKRSEELELLARVAGGFCHDFNNVLQAVVTNLQIADTTQHIKYVKPALDAALSGVSLSREMLQLAQPDITQDEQSEFDAIAAIRATVRWSGRVLRQSVAINLNLSLDNAVVKASEGRFTSSLSNLIINSQDAMERGGQINIAVYRRDRMLRIDVEDQGQGMSEELLCKAVEPFFSTKGEQGTGLGVYEAKTFAEGIGGSFTLSSALGVGTTATMEVPASFVATKKQSPTSQDPLNARVLLVEDKPEVRTSIQHLLESFGCTTVAVTNEQTARQILLNTNSDFYDVVVLDVVLDETLGGDELSDWITQRFPGLNVIFCSATPLGCDFSERVMAFQKPIDRDAFYNHLRRLRRRKLAK